MAVGDLFTLTDWIRVVEIPALLALGGLGWAHIQHDLRAEKETDKKIQEAEIRGAVAAVERKSEYLEHLLAVRTAGDADVSALRTQMTGFQLEVANTYAKSSDVVSHMNGLEGRLTRALADLKDDFNRRTDELLGLYKRDKG